MLSTATISLPIKSSPMRKRSSLPCFPMELSACIRCFTTTDTVMTPLMHGILHFLVRSLAPGSMGRSKTVLGDLIVCYLLFGGAWAGMCLVLSIMELLVPAACLPGAPLWAHRFGKRRRRGGRKRHDGGCRSVDCGVRVGRVRPSRIGVCSRPGMRCRGWLFWVGFILVGLAVPLVLDILFACANRPFLGFSFVADTSVLAGIHPMLMFGAT